MLSLLRFRNFFNLKLGFKAKYENCLLQVLSIYNFRLIYFKTEYNIKGW